MSESGTASAAALPAAGTARVSPNWGGWVNVGVGAVIMVATLPGRTQGLGLITEPMLTDLRLDRVAYANINLWATLLGAAIGLPIGRVFDRIGLRFATLAISVLLAGIVLAMSRLAGGALLLFGLVLLTRALGQSALSVASITAVGKSFDSRVGVAMGVYSVLLSVLFAVAFTLVGGSVARNGWRTAWAQVAVGLLFAGLLALLLRERHSAGEKGPDGSADGLTLAESLRTPAFWVFAGATSLFGLVSSGLGLFNQAVLAERGFDQQTYVRFLAGTSLIALVGQFGCGWLTLRWPMTRLLGIAMLIYAAAIAALPLLTTHVQLWIFAAFVGLAGGMITVMFFAVWRRAFGPAHLGRIQGAAQMLTVLASALGPLIFAKSQALTGSYFPALWLLSPCVLLVGVAAFRIALPRAAHAS